MTEAEIRQLAQEIARALKAAGIVQTGAGGSGSPDASGLFSKAVDGVVKLGSGAADASTVLNFFTGVMDKAGGAGAAFGKILDTVGRGVLDVNTHLQESSKYGVRLGNDLGEYNLLVKQSHLTFDQYNNVLAKGSANLASLGGGADGGARAFLRISQMVEDSKLGQSLRIAGASAEDLAEAERLSLIMRRGTDLTNAENQRLAGEAAGELALQLQRNAELTGVSVKQQQDDLARQMRKGEVELFLLKQGDDYKKAYTGMIDGALTGQAKVQDLASAIVTNSKLTKENQDTLALMGSAKGAFLDYVRNIGKGTKDEQDAREANFMAAQKNNVMSQQALNSAAGGVLNASEIYHEQINNATQVEAERQRLEKERNGAHVSDIEAAKSLIAKRRTIIPQTEEDDKRTQAQKDAALISETINKTKIIGELAGGVTAEGFRKLNVEIGKDEEGLRKHTNALREIMSIEGMKQFGGDLLKVNMDDWKKALHSNTPSGKVEDRKDVKPDAPVVGPNSPSESNRDRILREQNTQNPTPVPVTIVNPESNPVPVNPRDRRTDLNPNGDRDFGTFGKTGNIFETTDFFGKVKQGESVLTPGHMESLIKNSKNDGITNALESMQSLFAPLMNTVGAQKDEAGLPNIEALFAPLMKTISTTKTETTSTTDIANNVNIQGIFTTLSDNIKTTISSAHIPETINESLNGVANKIKISFDDPDFQTKLNKVLDSVKNPIKDASVSSAVPQSMFPELVGMVDSMKSALSKLNDIELENQRESDPIPEPVVPPVGTVLEPVMKDIKDLLQQLNTHMESVKTNTATQTDIGNKQINAIQKLSGNRFA